MLKIQLALRGIFTKRESHAQLEGVLFAKDQFQRLTERNMKMPVSIVRL